MIQVLVVDDHPIIREGVGSLLERAEDMILVGEAADGREAVELFQTLHPDVTLMDIQMPEMNGVQATVNILRHDPSAKVVVLTTYPGDVQAVCALKAGASGYLMKSSIRYDLLDVIRSVHAGSRHVDHAVAESLAMHLMDPPLADRETEVLRLVGRGFANKQIARSLGIAEETVKAHLKSVFAKLKVADRTHAVTEAVRRGFIEV